MKFTFKKIQDSIKPLALVISRGIKKFSLFKIVTDKYTLTVHQIPYPFSSGYSTSTERMNLA